MMNETLSHQSALRTLSVRDGLGEWLNQRGLTGRGVEVGVLYGGYSEIILKSWSGTLCLVDPWINQAKSVYFDGANKLDMGRVYAHVLANIGRHPRCRTYRAMSLNGVGYFDDGSLDFVYLDGNHATDAVRDEITAWWPKIKIGGLLCGHDFFTRYDNDTNSDALTAVMEFSHIFGVMPHVTWCTSWWFVKTEEMDARFRAANLDGRIAKPIYTNNSGMEPVVVIPVARFDWNLAVKMLRWWANITVDRPNPYPVVAFCTHELNLSQIDAIRNCGVSNLSVAVQAGLKEIGYFGSPNQMIRGALEYCERQYAGRPIIWIEADCVPMRESWVDEIMAEYRTCGKPFMGDAYRSTEPGPLPHMSGNAVYHPKWRSIAPSLAALGTEECGWDTICSHETLPRAHICKSIQQIWRPALPITAAWASSNIRETAALFHQCKDSSLIDVLCERRGMPRIPLAPALCETTYYTQKRKPDPAPFAPAAIIDHPPRSSLPIFAPRHKQYRQIPPKSFKR